MRADQPQSREGPRGVSDAVGAGGEAAGGEEGRGGRAEGRAARRFVWRVVRRARRWSPGAAGSGVNAYIWLATRRGARRSGPPPAAPETRNR
jgi:hypothetical protein